MFHHRRRLISLEDRGPLRVMFVLTSMPVGGAETLLAELVRRLDHWRFLPEICCLKEFGPLGLELSAEISRACRPASPQIRFRRHSPVGAAHAQPPRSTPS